jgi:hypothetical protein
LLSAEHAIGSGLHDEPDAGSGVHVTTGKEAGGDASAAAASPSLQIVLVFWQVKLLPQSLSTVHGRLYL